MEYFTVIGSCDAILRELSELYYTAKKTALKNGELKHKPASSLCYILNNIKAVISSNSDELELDRLQERVIELEVELRNAGKR